MLAYTVLASLVATYWLTWWNMIPGLLVSTFISALNTTYHALCLSPQPSMSSFSLSIASLHHPCPVSHPGCPLIPSMFGSHSLSYIFPYMSCLTIHAISVPSHYPSSHSPYPLSTLHVLFLVLHVLTSPLHILLPLLLYLLPLVDEAPTFPALSPP